MLDGSCDPAVTRVTVQSAGGGPWPPAAMKSASDKLKAEDGTGGRCSDDLRGLCAQGTILFRRRWTLRWRKRALQTIMVNPGLTISVAVSGSPEDPNKGREERLIRVPLVASPVSPLGRSSASGLPDEPTDPDPGRGELGS